MPIRSALLAAATLAFLSAAAFANDDKTVASLDLFANAAFGAPNLLSGDPVTASFLRMLTHEPNPVAPPAPAGVEKDPLIEALALPLLRWSAGIKKQTAQRM